MCVDYKDLNRASPKDNFPLPHIDTLIDNTVTNMFFSFMTGFSGSNQIKMVEEDKAKTEHWEVEQEHKSQAHLQHGIPALINTSGDITVVC